MKAPLPSQLANSRPGPRAHKPRRQRRSHPSARRSRKYNPGSPLSKRFLRTLSRSLSRRKAEKYKRRNTHERSVIVSPVCLARHVFVYRGRSRRLSLAHHPQPTQTLGTCGGDGILHARRLFLTLHTRAALSVADAAHPAVGSALEDALALARSISAMEGGSCRRE